MKIKLVLIFKSIPPTHITEVTISSGKIFGTNERSEILIDLNITTTTIAITAKAKINPKIKLVANVELLLSIKTAVPVSLID